METLTFHLEEFDGPLDLLLYLVSKNKMDLHNIPILELIEQYTSIIDGLGAQRMEAASEFIEMAARLVQMKSYLLLPRSEEAERMKEELTGELLNTVPAAKLPPSWGKWPPPHLWRCAARPRSSWTAPTCASTSRGCCPRPGFP